MTDNKSHKQVQQHLAQYDADDIAAICQPMRQHFGLKSLVFKRVYRDGREVNLTTHPEWVSYYFENKLYQGSVLEKEIDNYVHGHLLWSQIPTHSPILDAVKQRYGIANGLTLIRPNADQGYCDFFFMGADADHTQFAQLCTNNMDLLDQFVAHFRYHAQELLARLVEQPIHVVDKYDSNNTSVFDIPCYQNQSRRHQFLADLNRHGVVLMVDGESVRLSRRETEVARCLLAGMTMKQAAEKLHISPRTVETHVQHLKQKLKADKKSALIKRLKSESRILLAL